MSFESRYGVMLLVYFQLVETNVNPHPQSGSVSEGWDKPERKRRGGCNTSEDLWSHLENRRFTTLNYFSLHGSESCRAGERHNIHLISILLD